MSTPRSALFAALTLIVSAGTPPAATAQPPAPLVAPHPDERFKLDVLLLVAHPDDDVLAGSYLAKIGIDGGKKVGVVFATRGDAGGNQVGVERAASLGLVRELEARRDLESLGIHDVWFLQGRDTPSQNPLLSLANWDHGRTLGEAVRLVRLTRPDVILTWLPMPVVGENHGDHQAASVLATEAFDLAADPTVFPSQVAASSGVFEPRLENLRAWQPKKLYFMSDASDTRFMEGHGPSYSIKEVSPSRKVPYWQLVLGQLASHRTQFAGQYDQLMRLDTATREQAITANPGGEGLIEPLRLVLGKSHVAGRVTGDVFEGIDPPAASGAGRGGGLGAARSSEGARGTIELGAQWHFYRQFWAAHGLTEMPAMDDPAIGPMEPTMSVRVPIRVSNPSNATMDVTLASTLPAGWTEDERPAAVRLAPGDEYTFESIVRIPKDAPARTEVLKYAAGALGVVSVKVVVKMSGAGLPQ